MMQVTCLYRPAVQFGSPAAAQQWRLLSVCTISWPLIGGGKLVLSDLTLYVLSELHFPIWLKHTFPFEYKSNATLTLYHYIIVYYTFSIFVIFFSFFISFFIICSLRGLRIVRSEPGSVLATIQRSPSLPSPSPPNNHLKLTQTQFNFV